MNTTIVPTQKLKKHIRQYLKFVSQNIDIDQLFSSLNGLFVNNNVIILNEGS